MAFGAEAVGFADLIAECDEFGQIDVDGFAGIEADDQVLGVRAVGELVAGLVAVGEDALDDARVEHELDGSVDGGFGDSKAGGADLVEEPIGLENVVDAENGVEHMGPLGRVLEPRSLEIASKDRTEGLDDLELGQVVVRVV